MDTIYRGRLDTAADRRNAWIDALFVDHAVFRLINPNIGTVVPGRMYRAAHPTPGTLARLARRYKLRTVINLRGLAKNGSDALTREMAAKLGLAFIDAPLESRGAPQRDRILRLATAFRDMAEPALVHCKSGADRAGLAAGLFLLTHGGSARDALAQLSWRFGHIRQSRTGVLDAFFMLYARQAEGRKPFLDWVRDDYDEAKLRRDFKSDGLGRFVNDWVLARE